MSLLGVQLDAQAAQVLRLLQGFVALTGGSLTHALFMVEATTMELGVRFHIRSEAVRAIMVSGLFDMLT